MVREKLQQNLLLGRRRAIERASLYCGLSMSTVKRILRCGRQDYPDPGTPNVRKQDMAMDEEDAAKIRPAIAELTICQIPFTIKN